MARSENDVVIPSGMEGSYKQLHFAPAVRDGDRLFCSGQLGNRGDGTLPEDPAEQFEQAFLNVASVLAAAGASMEDIVEITTFHVGFNQHIARFMQVKDRHVAEPYPAWTAIGVAELGFGALVEIKVIARL